MKSKLVWLAIAAFALGCDDEPKSSDADSSGGASGNGSGGTGNSGQNTDPACVGGEALILSLTSNGNPVSDMGLREFEATLTSSTEDSAVLETCPGEGGEGGGGGAGGEGATGEDGCLTLEIQARGLALPISVGTTVDVQWNLVNHYMRAPSATMVVLRDLGDDMIGGFLLGVGNGLEFPDSPVTYTSRELFDCNLDNTGYCSARMAYELIFTAVDNPSSSATLTMGETGRLELDPSSDAEWRVHNISSMTSGGCDALDPTRYYVVRDF